MKRYLSLVRLFWSTAIAAEMEYRVNFWLAAFSSIGNLAGSLFTLFLFYRTGYTFNQWPWQEALIILGVFTLLQGLSTTFLVPNLNRIVKHVEQGTLDFVLLKPISSQFWLSTYSFSPWGLPDVILGALVVFYGGSQLSPPLTLINYLSAIPPLLFGFLILYSLWFMLGATSIWFVKIYNVTEVLRGLVEAGRYPMSAYPAGFRFFFTFVVPIAFLTTVPTQALLHQTQWQWIGGSGLLAIVLFIAANRFWQFALRFYTSASS
jgi:ABC-2 type transport system permease protein